jgi:hypothetical protein
MPGVVQVWGTLCLGVLGMLEHGATHEDMPCVSLDGAHLSTIS